VAGWDSFAEVAGAAAGALIGLLFVAVSIRIEVIARSVEFRNRGAQTLGLFVLVLLVAIVLSVPAQARWVLGVELIVIAMFVGIVLSILDRRAQSAPSAQPIARILEAVSPNALTSVLLATAGVLLLLGVDDGIYVLVPTVALALVGGVVSAWLFLTKLTA